MFTNKNDKKIVIIGISGVTCGGKTTVATQLKNVLPKCTIFSQDDYFRDETDPLHVWVPELNHINFDILSSVDMDKMFEDVLKFIKNNNFNPFSKKKDVFNEKAIHSSDSDKDVCYKIESDNIHIIIIEGFLIFNYQKWLNLFNLKYYFTLNKEECYKRRVNRVYEPPDCPGYFEKVAWPEYLTSMQVVKESVKDIKFVDNIEQNFFQVILNDLSKYVNDSL